MNMSIAYLATEFAGDPPEPVARWYKLEAGTYARYCDGEVTIYHQADIKMQRSLEHSIEHVPGDGDPGEVEHVARAWRIHHGGAH